jgi:Transposase domain (DUF772)
MRKVQRIFETNQEINFISPRKEFSLYWQQYQQSTLGKLSQIIPWRELAKSLKIKDSKKGPLAIFSPRGKLALMFLKAYTNLSDRKLVENLNGNIHFQMFCDVFLGIVPLSNAKIVSGIRCELSRNLDIRHVQKCLAEAWKPYLTCTNVMLEDATCYESSMRYPTNVKLLWESSDWVYGQTKRICKMLKIRSPRNKFLEQKDKYYQYSHKRQRSNKETVIRTRSLLHLLEKLLGQLKQIEDQYEEKLEFPKKYYKNKAVIKKILQQQKKMFETGKSIPDRIVSISKSYIRPIVRGKEVKKVEFGPKVNMIQIDGINFIEHFSFKPFNESTHYLNSVRYGRELFGKITHTASDKIYATNKNRKYSSRQKITTNFVRKGRAGKYEDQRLIMASELNKERATRMEGSFGTEKEHYGLNKIKARIETTEILWVFFGVHTSNAIRIVEKIHKAYKKSVAA